MIIPKSKWISIRLDLRSFSKISSTLFSKKYNVTFGNLMSETMKDLMKEFNAQIGFTQSDEITILISSCCNSSCEIYENLPQKCPNHSHIFGGKRDKLVIHKFKIYF